MPVVQIDWLGKEERDESVKRKLVEEISKAFETVGVSKDTLHIIIRDIPENSWGNKGQLMSERKKN